MRKLTTFLLASVLILSLCSCGNTNSVGNFNSSDNISESSNPNNSLEMVNPWTEYKTIDEAEKAAGFSFSTIKSAEINTVAVMITEDMNVIKATFYDGDNLITIKKGNTTNDISCDSRDFKNSIEETKDNITLTYKGNNDTYGLVSWIKDNYSYSISCETETTKDILDSFINVIFDDVTIEFVGDEAGGVVMDVNMPEIITIIEP